MKCVPLPGLLQMVRSVLRHHQEAIARKEQQGRDERQKLKKIANTIAKEVKQFWDSINRVCTHTHTHTHTPLLVPYTLWVQASFVCVSRVRLVPSPCCHCQLAQHKQQMVLEAKCKKALDMHLSFIVDQTEKYSTWLVKDFAEKPSAAGLGGQQWNI